MLDVARDHVFSCVCTARTALGRRARSNGSMATSRAVSSCRSRRRYATTGIQPSVRFVEDQGQLSALPNRIAQAHTVRSRARASCRSSRYSIRCRCTRRCWRTQHGLQATTHRGPVRRTEASSDERRVVGSLSAPPTIRLASRTSSARC